LSTTVDCVRGLTASFLWHAESGQTRTLSGFQLPRYSGTATTIRSETTLELLSARSTVAQQSTGGLDNTANGAPMLPRDAIQSLKSII
jgi:hypothetical protein